MKTMLALSVGMLVSLPAISSSPFDGVWRPDPQRGDPKAPDNVLLLNAGDYSCSSCQPPVHVKADGMPHPIEGNPRYDHLSIKVIDAHHVNKLAKKGNATIVEASMEISSDGNTLTERQIMSDAGPRPVDFTSVSTRTAPAPAGAHPISGSWHFVEADLTHHDEDTEYHVTDGYLTMSDHMGRSFKAKLDGTDAPYRGDTDFDAVSLKQIDARTIEETDKKAGKPVKVTRWQVDKDGKTMHVQFDDLHGHIQHQNGHRVS